MKPNIKDMPKHSKLLDSYYVKCSDIKKAAFSLLKSNKEIYNCLVRDDIDDAENEINENLYYVGEIILGEIDDGQDYDYDQALTYRDSLNLCIEIMLDLKKFKKIFKNYGQVVSSSESIDCLIGCTNGMYEDIQKKNSRSEYIRISKKLGNNANISSVIMELFKSPLNIDIDRRFVEYLFDEFGFDYKKYDLDKLISSKLEELEAEKFENEILGNSEESLNDNNHQNSDFIEDGLPATCPYCTDSFLIPAHRLPSKNENEKLSMQCPECSVELSLTFGPENFICLGCHKEFETLLTKHNHFKSCPKVKERTNQCTACGKSFILDDIEFDKLVQFGEFEVECCHCGDSSQIFL